MILQNRQIHLVRRPIGIPSLTDFALVESELADPANGEVQVRNLLMSVDPYMRPRLAEAQPLNQPLLGGGVGQVTASRVPRLKEGDLVRHDRGFETRFNASPASLTALKTDPDLPLSVYLHALGATGMTAYCGMLDVAGLREGDEVYVSTAAGAVGSVAAQIAKIKGCYVVGSAGSADKCDWLLNEACVDAAFNYKAGPIGEALEALTPRGLDVYFDNVGGRHLDAALARMNRGGRVAVCGMISAYNDAPEPVLALPRIIYGRVSLTGFVGSDFPERAGAFATDMISWLKSGQIQYRESILDGIERTPEALIGLFHGMNDGKMLVRIAE